MNLRRVTTVLLAAAALLLGLIVTPSATAATQRSINCARAGQAAGWSGSTLVTAVAIALAESDCTAGAQHWNPPDGSCPNGSLDRGAWQINDCYQSWVSDSCAYDLYCNARAAHTIYGWSGWGAWTTYNTGAYRSYLSEAQAGVNAIGGGGGVAGTVTTAGDVLYVRSGPGTGYSVVGSLADGSAVTISCQAHGEWIYSEVYGIWTDLWDRIGSGRYVSDGYVYTGSNGQVAPTC
jgi:uncharacterized protein YgiM (DUF1202 family)